MKFRAVLLFLCGLVLSLSTLLEAQVPRSDHVWIIAEENHSYESVIGSSSMPYFNSLAQKYGLSTQYYAVQHSSLPALMWLVAGQAVTQNNNTTSCFNADNVVRHLLAKGLTWKSYQVDLPYPGFQGLSWLNYVRRHNPLIDFTDTCASGQKNNSVPYGQLAIDMANNATPNYIWITPNLQEDAHDGTLAQADAWLAQEMPAILNRPEFKPGGDGMLFVVFDEGNLSGDTRCSSRISTGCGGRIATLVIGPQVRPGYQSSSLYSHPNLLRTVCDSMGFASCPGAGAVASPMTDFFNTVQIAMPLANAQVASPVHIKATTNNSSPVSTVQIYVDGGLAYQVKANSVDTLLPMNSGKHYVVVQSWDTAGGIHKRGLYVTVQNQAVNLTSPTPNATVSSPVPVQATANGVSPVKTMKVLLDGALVYQTSGNTVNTNVSMTTGQHAVTVQAVDQAGGVTSSSLNVSAHTPSMVILSPGANASMYSPVSVSAITQDPSAVNMVQLYVDNMLHYETNGIGMQISSVIAPGNHYLVLQGWDKSGGTFKQGVNINVLNIPVTISTPANNATVNSPVTIKASVPSSSSIIAMQIYVDNALQYTTSGQSVNTSLAMNSGKHYIVVKAWDSYGGTYTSSVNIKVP